MHLVGGQAGGYGSEGRKDHNGNFGLKMQMQMISFSLLFPCAVTTKHGLSSPQGVLLHNAASDNLYMSASGLGTGFGPCYNSTTGECMIFRQQLSIARL
jgi:hypothetical protein